MKKIIITALLLYSFLTYSQTISIPDKDAIFIETTNGWLIHGIEDGKDSSKFIAIMCDKQLKETNRYELIIDKKINWSFLKQKTEKEFAFYLAKMREKMTVTLSSDLRFISKTEFSDLYTKNQTAETQDTSVESILIRRYGGMSKEPSIYGNDANEEIGRNLYKYPTTPDNFLSIGEYTLFATTPKQKANAGTSYGANSLVQGSICSYENTFTPPISLFCTKKTNNESKKHEKIWADTIFINDLGQLGLYYPGKNDFIYLLTVQSPKLEKDQTNFAYVRKINYKTGKIIYRKEIKFETTSITNLNLSFLDSTEIIVSGNSGTLPSVSFTSSAYSNKAFFIQRFDIESGKLLQSKTFTFLDIEKTVNQDAIKTKMDFFQIYDIKKVNDQYFFLAELGTRAYYQDQYSSGILTEVTAYGVYNMDSDFNITYSSITSTTENFKNVSFSSNIFSNSFLTSNYNNSYWIIPTSKMDVPVKLLLSYQKKTLKLIQLWYLNDFDPKFKIKGVSFYPRDAYSLFEVGYGLKCAAIRIKSIE